MCPEGDTEEGATGKITQTVLVAWAETMVRQRGVDNVARVRRLFFLARWILNQSLIMESVNLFGMAIRYHDNSVIDNIQHAVS